MNRARDYVSASISDFKKLRDKTLYSGGRNNPYLKNIGVYFLCWGGKIVYIGSSENIWARIGKHMSEQKKKWDEWFYVQCDNFLEVERDLIKLMKPKYNRSHNGGPQYRGMRVKINGKFKTIDGFMPDTERWARQAFR